MPRGCLKLRLQSLKNQWLNIVVFVANKSVKDRRSRFCDIVDDGSRQCKRSGRTSAERSHSKRIESQFKTSRFTPSNALCISSDSQFQLSQRYLSRMHEICLQRGHTELQSWSALSCHEEYMAPSTWYNLELSPSHRSRADQRLCSSGCRQT